MLRGADQGANSSYLLAAVGRQLLHTHRCNEAPHSLIWCACPPAGEHGPTPEALRAYEAFRQPLVSWYCCRWPCWCCYDAAVVPCCRLYAHHLPVALLPLAAWRLQMEVIHRRSAEMFIDFKAGGAPPQVRHRCFCFSCCSGGVKSSGALSLLSTCAHRCPEATKPAAATAAAGAFGERGPGPVEPQVLPTERRKGRAGLSTE